LHLDQDNAQIQLIEDDDGRIELRSVVAIPADQAWFWAERWQEMEREADKDAAAGRTTVVDGLTGLQELFAADDAAEGSSRSQTHFEPTANGCRRRSGAWLMRGFRRSWKRVTGSLRTRVRVGRLVFESRMSRTRQASGK